MSGVKAGQYAAVLPNEGGLATSRDTTAPRKRGAFFDSARRRGASALVATDPLLAAREGPTDAQIADAPQQCLPHLTDPASLRDSRAGKQHDRAGTSEKGKQAAAQGKRTCTTRQATQTQPAALAELHALHHTHREATRLFLMAASQGATDAQIADALWQGLPHLTDRASLQDQSFGKQPQGIGVQAEQGKKDYKQKKRTRTTSQATQTRPLLLAADAFSAALEAIPAQDWCRTWAAGRMIMLRRTSKRVKEVVDKMRLPAVVRLSQNFWYDARNGTAAEKLELIWRQLPLMTGWCRITTLELPCCNIEGQDAESLAGVLAHFTALAHLDLSDNLNFGAAGAEMLAGVLGQCRELVHLNLSGNYIRAGGAESLAGVLGQCAALAHLDLGHNQIGNAGTETLAGVLVQCPALAQLDLYCNEIGSGGAKRLAGVLAQCPALAHLNICGNFIGNAGAKWLAGVLGQCTALTQLDLSYNDIGDSGAESLAGVLGQCASLAHLDLWYNKYSAVLEGRLRASWRGQASGLILDEVDHEEEEV
jgi:Ran GTPase-activating protein (RanGAP) involved in mRNA processing and transport